MAPNIEGVLACVKDWRTYSTMNWFWRRIGNESEVFDWQIRLALITFRVVLVLSPPRTVLVIVIERLKETLHQKALTITSTGTNNRKYT